MNRKKKNLYYQTRINEVKNDSKQLWKTINNALGRGSNTASLHLSLKLMGHLLLSHLTLLSPLMIISLVRLTI